MRLLALAVASLLLSACSRTASPFTDSCSATIEVNGQGYSEVGFSSHDKVVAVKQDGDTFRVFVADGLGEEYVTTLHETGLLNAGQM